MLNKTKIINKTDDQDVDLKIEEMCILQKSRRERV